jgi:hypothetical protein
MSCGLTELIGLEEDRDEIIRLIQTMKKIDTDAKYYIDLQIAELYSLQRSIEQQIASMEKAMGIKHQTWWRCIF